MQNKIEEATKLVAQAKEAARETEKLLNELVQEHETGRLELFKQKLSEKRLAWCTSCLSLSPAEEVYLIFIEGTETYSCGYENSCYAFQKFAKLHRACESCKSYFSNQHGRRGAYDSFLHDQESFYAFAVEKRQDGYYASRFGCWQKLDPQHSIPENPPERLIRKLAKEFGLPPKMELDWNGQLKIDSA